MGLNKIWIVDNPTVADIIWAKGLGCPVRYDDAVTTDISTYATTMKFVIFPARLTITSTCEKQESMLKLKFVDNLQLIQTYDEHGI